MSITEVKRLDYYWFVFLAFVGFSFWQIYHHAMWADEWQAWLIAAESTTLPSLWQNVRFEPQLGMWHVILWLLSRVSSNPLIMQFFHLTCGIATNLLIVVCAPFSRFIRLMIVLGYYFSFEYLLISRNYVIGVFLVVLFCAAYDKFRTRPLTGGTILGILAHTSIFGAMISLGLFGGLIADVRRKTSANWSGFTRYLLFAASVYSGLLLLSFVVMSLSRDAELQGWFLAFDLGSFLDVAAHLIMSLVPVPDPSITFWNTSIVLQHASSGLIFLTCIAVLGSAFLALIRSKIAASVFVYSFVIILSAEYLKSYYTIHHSGHLFIIFVACAWLGARQWASKDIPPALLRLSSLCLSAILGLGLIAGLMAGYFHATRPFSNSKAIAEYLRSNYGVRPLVVHQDFAFTPVSGYLKRKVYMASTEQPGSFIRSTGTRRLELSSHDILRYAYAVSEKTGVEPLVVLNYREETWEEYLVGSAEGAIVGDENYFAYDFRDK